MPSTPAPLQLVEARIARRDPGVDQGAKALRHACYVVEYATARDEAAHDGARRRARKQGRLRPAAGAQCDENATAIRVGCPDHPDATLPGHLARLRFEHPPVRAD